MVTAYQPPPGDLPQVFAALKGNFKGLLRHLKGIS